MVHRFRRPVVALGVSVLVALVACSPVRQAASIDELTGTWVYDDGHGFVSTMIIDSDGSVLIDLAPSEVFLPENWRSITDWSHEVDLESALSVEGRLTYYGDELRIRATAPILFEGGQQVYVSPGAEYLSFGVGDADYANWVRYARSE